MTNIKKYNFFGDDITGKEKRVRKPEYIRLQNGKEEIAWPLPSSEVDGNGFDKTFEKNGQYISEITLKKGTLICRFGEKTGYCTAPIGTPYEMLSLPYDIRTVEYHEYEVISDNLSVYPCRVKEGKVYPCFDQVGGGIQYLHYVNINEEMKRKTIKEVRPCLMKQPSST